MTSPREAALLAFPEVRSDAVLSEDGVYRYALMRRWAQGHPLRFVMLNPSTADATLDDPTIRRCMGFARREGFAALIVVNLYAYRSTDPKALLTCDDPVGPSNDEILWAHLSSARAGGNPVVAAWGANAKPDRAERVLGLVPGVDWRCLGTTKSGAPKHPLYIAGAQPLVPFGEPAGASEPWRCEHGVDTRTCEACASQDEAFADSPPPPCRYCGHDLSTHNGPYCMQPPTQAEASEAGGPRG